MKETKGMKIVILNISDDGKGFVFSAKLLKVKMDDITNLCADRYNWVESTFISG